MRHIFDIERTVRTFRLHFGGEHEEVLRELLFAVARALGRALPEHVSRQIDREGSRLARSADGQLTVVRHPALEAARQALAELGLFRVFAAERYGGFALPLGVYYLAVQLVSYFDTALALVFLVHGNAMYVIERYGSGPQRERYLPALAAGELLASVAFTEPQAGSDAGSIRMRAEPIAGGWRLDGNKLFITHGGDADLLVTTARTGPLEAGIDGVSAFLVERAADGVELLGLEDKTGLAGSPTAALGYSGVQLPSDRLLGTLNRGGEVMFAGVGMTRVNIGAQALGIAKRAFDAAVDFALEREQGGRRIVEHDAIRQRLADMALCIAAMEGLICRDAHLEAQKQWHVREMSVAKYYCSEALQELTLRAINVFGGYGVCREHVVERCRREAAALPLYGGTSEIQWYIIARELGDVRAGRARADYRGRDAALAEALARSGNARVAQQAQRLVAAQDQLWRAVDRVAALADGAPFWRHLAELATAAAVAEALLLCAADDVATALDAQLVEVALDRLEDRASVTTARIAAGADRRALKAALRAALPD